jgi:hypothetical protein
MLWAKCMPIDFQFQQGLFRILTNCQTYSTSPYLRNLATEAKSRAAMIWRLSFGVPPNLLRLLANGLVIGKILAAAPAAIPLKLDTI